MIEIREARLQELPQVFALRFKRYSGLGWLNPDDYPDRQEKDKYDERSAHFVALVDGCIKGYVRLILPGAEPFPMEDEFGKLTPEHYGVSNGAPLLPAEVSRFIVEKDNGCALHSLSLGLLQVLIRHSVRLGVTHWCQALDIFVHRLVGSWHFNFKKCGPKKHFMGSETVPTVLEVDAFFRELKDYDPRKFRFFATDFPADQIASEAEIAYSPARTV